MTFVIVVNINTVDYMYFEIQPTENQSKGQVSNKTTNYYFQQQNSTILNPCQTGSNNHAYCYNKINSLLGGI